MKKIYLLLILTISTLAAQASSRIESADSAYSADQFNQALSLYLEAAKDDGVSSELYFNIGNCYYRLDQPGMAVLYYERSLKLDPANEDAKTNLNFVNSKIVDRINDDSTVMSKLIDSISSIAHTNTWSWIAIGCFTLMLIAIGAYIFSSLVPLRKICFFGGIFLFLAVVFTIIMAVVAADKISDDNRAVIIAPSTQLSTSPRIPKDRSEEAILLHEGTVVEIVDSVATPNDTINPLWYDVKIDRAHRAWVSQSAVERI